MKCGIIPVVALLLFLSCTGRQASEMKPGDSAPTPAPLPGEAAVIYPIVYGSSDFSEEFIFSDGTSRTRPFAWMFYAIESKNSLILVDCGFSDVSMAAYFGIRDFLPPDKALSKSGFDSSQVTAIVITHGHFDHIGGLSSFPGVPVYLAEAVYQDVMNSQYPAEAVRALNDGRTVHRYSEAEADLPLGLLPTIVSGHAAGSTVYRLPILNDTYSHVLFTGDEAYVSENIADKRPIGTRINTKKNLAFLTEGIKSDDMLFLFHDFDAQQKPVKIRIP